MEPTHTRIAGRDEYLSTNERKEAVIALEMTADLLERVENNRSLWGWVVIALHNAAQAFMVLALQGTWSVTVLHRDQRTKKLQAQRDFYAATEAGDKEAAERANEIMLSPEGDLAAFIHLYDRIKDPDGIMDRYMHSQVFVARATDDQCMTCLNDLRNEFMHFLPMTRGHPSDTISRCHRGRTTRHFLPAERVEQHRLLHGD